jgi:hypothetical protein
MSHSITIDYAPQVGVRSVDVNRGQRDGTLSQQWFSRPSDQRFTDLTTLLEFLRARNLGMREDIIEARDIRIVAEPDQPRELRLVAPDDGDPIAPTNIAFQQMCKLAGAPYSYMREKPAYLVMANLMDDYFCNRELRQKVYWNRPNRELRAFTGEGYGRIPDSSLTEAVHKIAGNGIGDTHWKVPGQINWGNMTYNPYVDVTKETTTLFASDRDVFLFLCDDTRPLEIGKLPNGDPDLIFRGFYAWNSEVGERSLGISTFWLRAVCQNRNLWGVESLDSIKINHTRYAPDRFAREAEPKLISYAKSEPTKLLAGINAARTTTVATDKDERLNFLKSLDFSKVMAEKVIAAGEREEGRTPRTAWDFSQAITAVARTIEHQDKRLDLERKAARIMDRATRGSI